MRLLSLIKTQTRRLNNLLRHPCVAYYCSLYSMSDKISLKDQLLTSKFGEFLTFGDSRNVENRGKPLNTKLEAADN